MKIGDKVTWRITRDVSIPAVVMRIINKNIVMVGNGWDENNTSIVFTNMLTKRRN